MNFFFSKIEPRIKFKEIIIGTSKFESLKSTRFNNFFIETV